MNPDSATLLGLCMLGLTAMACLCLSMPRHARQVAKHASPPDKQTPLRWAGWLLIGTMLACAVARGGWGQGLVWTMSALTASAVFVIGLLSYRPGWLVYAATSGLLGGVLAVGVSII